MDFGSLAIIQNKKPSIRILYIFKMLCAKCSKKEAISLLLSRSTQKFNKKKTFKNALLVDSQNKNQIKIKK